MVELPSVDQIITQLNINSVWTREELIALKNRLSLELFAPVRRCFELLTDRLLPSLARNIVASIERQRLEYAEAIASLNRHSKDSNAERKFLIVKKNEQRRIIPEYKIRVPTENQIVDRLIREKVQTYSDVYGAGDKISEEIFAGIKRDPDFSSIKHMINLIADSKWKGGTKA